jgi:HPt (histidine-containing phosphotransfer) domain-containing protein
MSAPLGRREFFVIEAGEYLERLAALVAAPGQPDGERFVRDARALRGAAQMAGPPAYDNAAAAIEHLAKSTRDGSLAWTPILADRLADALEDCKGLLRQVREWGDAEVSRCERLARAINGLAGGQPRPAPAAPPGMGSAALTAGVRAFVARESAAVAAALDQVAETIEHAPRSTSAATVLQRLQPLRGLGALPGLSPLPEMLEALDLTLATGGKGGSWPPGGGRALHAAAAALARMARDIAELGMPQADSHEVVQATELLREAFSDSADVVPIASLFRSGDADPILARGIVPPPPHPPTDLTVELISLADRLRMSAGQMTEQAGWATRALQLHTLTFALRGLVMSAGVKGGAGPLLASLDRETMAGRAAREPAQMAVLLHHAADALVEAAAAGETTGLGPSLAPLVQTLDSFAGAPAVEEAAVGAPTLEEPAVEEPATEEPAPAPAPHMEAALVASESLPFAEPDTVPVETLAPDENDVVPVESLAPDVREVLTAEPFTPDETDVVSIESLLYDAEPERVPRYSALERSFSTYFRLMDGQTNGETVETRIEPIEVETLPPETRAPVPELPIVPIESLLLRGRRALERADVIRGELNIVLKARRDLSGVETLLAELLDLVPLALADDI